MFVINIKKNRIQEMLRERLFYLKTNVEIINRRIDGYPEGVLKVRKDKKGYSYYTIDKESRRIHYIKKENIQLAKMMAQRDYDYCYLRIAKREITDIERILSKGFEIGLEECYSKAHDGRKTLISPFDMPDEDYIRQWMSIPFKAKEFSENDMSEYYTEKGERVRSKSEVIIANMLYHMGIPYKYECPIKLGTITVYPDFTILDVRNRCVKYLEHFGMMGDSDYVSNMMSKIYLYEQNGIYVGDRLICSFESGKKPLNVNSLKKKLKAIFCQ